MEDQIPRKYIIGFGLIVLLMFASLIYGFCFIQYNQDNNCWSKYSTEQQAIKNCETNGK